MRRCCEETMRVLRDNHEALLILIEVPLMSQAGWSCVHRTSSALSPAEPCALLLLRSDGHERARCAVPSMSQPAQGAACLLAGRCSSTTRCTSGP
jgi:hypothetical protein